MSAPSPQRIVRLLKDGYWDHTEVLEMTDGSLRVRKRNRTDVAPSPWGLESLRREIRYLAQIADRPAAAFPPLLDHWDTVSPSGQADIGYDHPFYAQHRDAGQLAREGSLPQSEANAFQDDLAAAMLNEVQIASPCDKPFSAHLDKAVREAFASLRALPEFSALLDAPQIQLNGRTVLGPVAAWHHITHETDLLADLDRAPHTRIHGDFFLENILWCTAPTDGSSRLILIDPVSVAGVSVAPPVFDLVKYISYATGELLALRSEWLTVSGFEAAASAPSANLLSYTYALDYDHAELAAMRAIDWHSRFEAAFLRQHGSIDRRIFHLIDGYFSAAMAANTHGDQQKARLLKAVHEFNTALLH